MTEPTHQKIERLKSQLQLTIVGQERLLNRLIVALISGGHVLVEGLPGLAKTTAIKALAEAVAARFKRIQFTPDLLPGDITGTDVYEVKTGDFRFIEGPLFNDIVLADEINRAPAKVQSALLEAMQERQITAGGETRALSKIFLVMATQNPVEQSGTYRLPEAQLDRFMFQVLLTYPTEEQELEVLRRSQASLNRQNAALSIPDLLKMRDEAAAVHLSDAVAEYIVRLVRATREIDRWVPSRSGTIDVGASPRAVLSMAAAAKAYALVCARDHVLPDDVQALAPDILRHRVSLSLQASVQKLEKDQLISELLKAVPSP
ncbi:COG0714 MoxR-like ATPases [Burkholderiales bacterium]